MKQTSSYSAIIGSHKLDITLHFPNHEKDYSSLEYKIVETFVNDLLLKEKTLSPFQVMNKAHVYNILPLTKERILSPDLHYYDYHLFCHEKPLESFRHVGTQFSSDKRDGHTALLIPNHENPLNQEITATVQFEHSEPVMAEQIQLEPVSTAQRQPGLVSTEQHQPEPVRAVLPEPHPVQQQCVQSESELTDMSNENNSQSSRSSTPDEFDSLTSVLEVMDFDAAQKSLNFGKKFALSYTTMTMVTKLQSLVDERLFSVNDCISEGHTRKINRISMAQSALNATENVEIDIPHPVNGISIEVANNSQRASQSAEQLRDNAGVSVNEREDRSHDYDAAEVDPEISTDLIKVHPEMVSDSQDTQADLEAEDRLMIVEDEEEIPDFGTLESHDSESKSTPMTPNFYDSRDRFSTESSSQESSYISPSCPQDVGPNICLEHLTQGTTLQYRKILGES